MAGYILREDQPNIVLPAQQADRLIGRGDGDAALLYLCLLRADRGVTAQELQRRLKWSQLRLHAAETALQELGLIDRPPEQKPPEPAQERPVYTADDLTDLLTGDAGFRMLVPQTEEKLGKRLKTADLQILAGLYDDLGLPADVIYLLVCHCVTRSEERYGPGRRPTLRQIEKEGYHWAQRGLFDQESASQYLRDWNVRRSAMSRYMQVLGLGDRRPVESEERYIADWMDKGFSVIFQGVSGFFKKCGEVWRAYRPWAAARGRCGGCNAGRARAHRRSPQRCRWQGPRTREA